MLSTFNISMVMADFGRRLYERGMLVGTEGNISVRLDEHRIVVTPAGFPKWGLSAEDMVVVDYDGKCLEGSNQPSSELLMHLFVYKNRPEIGACVHSHPPNATAYAVAGIPLAEDILPEVVLFVGRIPVTDYAQPGTADVPKVLQPYIATCNAFMLRNHGLLTIGRNLEEAFYRHETVEHCAKVIFLASQLGRVQAIPSQDLERLRGMRGDLKEGRDKSF
ncbi:MAG: class II aldolase/adducin family protein [Candidatus Zixiibacteriota bacterium]